MKKNLLIGSIICLIIVILFFVIGKSFNRVPKLEISEESWDFGAIKTGSDLKHTIIIKNTGSAELNLYAYPNCPACMLLELEKYDIPSKSETKLHIKLIDTEEGPYEGYIMLESNDPAKQIRKLTVKGTFIKQ